MIDETGITVVPITSANLVHAVASERQPTGIPNLDAMLGGGGYYRGSTVLISGTAGTGKSSLCAHFADAVCRADERCLYVSYEESPRQLQRNMASIGLEGRSALGAPRHEAVKAQGREIEVIVSRRGGAGQSPPDLGRPHADSKSPRAHQACHR